MVYRFLITLLLLLVSTAPTAAPAQRIPLHSWPGGLTLCGEPVPLHLQDVREMMDQAFIASVYNQPQVILWIKRAHRYFPYVEKRLRERKLPDDLKYIAVVESALKTYVFQRPGHGGAFINGTAKRYGLRTDRWIDERYHFERATEAALDYLSDLYGEFRNWTLAIAAYNCGETVWQPPGTGSGFTTPTCPWRPGYIFRILAAKTSSPDRRSAGTPSRRPTAMPRWNTMNRLSCPMRHP